MLSKSRSEQVGIVHSNTRNRREEKNKKRDMKRIIKRV
jgi:hypothetical protein